MFFYNVKDGSEHRKNGNAVHQEQYAGEAFPGELIGHGGSLHRFKIGKSGQQGSGERQCDKKMAKLTGKQMFT
jgi:hypothetical protein